MRKLVRKVIVDEIEPMDADTLEVARIGGWRVVVKKGDFHQGDTGLFFEIDSALNPHDDRFAFLKDRCYKKFLCNGRLFDECIRIKTMKLRGVVSQGLLLNPELFCEVRNFNVDEDCSQALAVRHYDEVAEKVIKMTTKGISPTTKGLFPSFIPRTDEERIQNLTDDDIVSHEDIRLEVTAKDDGSSCTFFYARNERPDDPFGVCSRNLELKTGYPSPWSDKAKELGIKDKLEKWCIDNNAEIAIQGELVGPGMNNNRDLYESTEFHVFRIFDITNKRWLTWNDRYDLCKELNLDHVKVEGYFTLKEFNNDRDAILKFAEGKTPRGNEREGLVWKSEDGAFTFKSVSNKYLLAIK